MQEKYWNAINMTHGEIKMKVANCISDLVGRTPLLELNNIKKMFDLKGNIYAKLEYLNPAGSAKDRIGKAMIEDALNKGLLSKDSVIIEPTSGNTGIGLAAVAASYGIKIILTMPETMSAERIKLLKLYGAEIILTEGSKGMAGAVEKAEELAKKYEHSYIPSQFDNPVNAEAHEKTTGPEIWADMDGKIDAFVAGIGTGGTITGTGRFLKSKNKEIQIVGVEPETSPLLSKGKAGPHKLQGIGANFIPKVLDQSILNQIITIGNEEAPEMVRTLAKSEGILVGISSGAALCAAIQLAEQEQYEGKNIVVLLPDTGDRYLSVL